MNRILLIGFTVSLVTTAAQSQTTVPPYRLIVQPDSATRRTTNDLGAISTVRTRTPMDDMRKALRDLAVAEEQYFAVRHEYTKDITALDIVVSSHGQPETEVLFAGTRSWSGRVKMPSLKGKSCVMFFGTVKDLPNGPPKTAAAGITATTAGVLVCDKP